MKIKDASSASLSCYNNMTVINCVHEQVKDGSEYKYESFVINKNNEQIAHFKSHKYIEISDLEFNCNLFTFEECLEIDINERNQRQIQLYRIENDNTCTYLNTYECIEEEISGGRFRVKRNGMYGFINADGEEVIEPQYEMTGCYFDDGYISVSAKKNRKWGVIDKENNVIIPLKYDTRDSFKGGYVVMKNYPTSDVYNLQGEIVFKGEKYQKIFNLGNGSILVENLNTREYEIVRLEKDRGDINMKELNTKYKRKTISEPFVEFHFDFENGIVKGYIAYPTQEEMDKNIAIDDAVRKRKQVLYKNFQIPEDYKSIIFEGLDTYIFPRFYSIERLKSHNEKYWSMVFISMFQKEIIQKLIEMGEYIEKTPNCIKIKNVSIVHPISKYDKLITIDCINEANYHTDEPPYDIYLLDKNNNLIAHFEDNEPFNVEVMDDGKLFAVILDSNEHELYKINRDNTYVLLNTYEDIEFGAEDDTYAVKKNGLWGFINTKGEEIIFPQYKEYNSFCNGFAYVSNQDGKWGVIDKENKIIVPFDYENPQEYHINSDYIVLKCANHYDVYNKKGTLILKGKEYQKIFKLGNGSILVENQDTNEYEIVRLKEC